MAIVNYKLKAQQAEKAFFNSDKVSEQNKKLMRKFLDVYDVSDARKEIFLKHIIIFLSKVNGLKKDMHNPDIINRIFRQLRDNYSPNYYNTIVNVSNRYVTWFNDGVKPKGFKDIKGIAKNKQKRKLHPNDMVTWEDGEKLINAASSIQLKAVIAAQLDGGFRPSEFIELHYGDIKQKGEFMVASVKDGKTGPRPVILWRAVPHLSRWLVNHRTKGHNDPLWLQENGRIKRYNYAALQKRIKDLGKKIKLAKPLDFYNLRHSACTISKLDNIPEEEAAKKFGHSVQYYTETYGRLTTEDSISRLSKIYGLDEEKKTIEKNVKCQKCDFINGPRSELCEKCGAALSIKKALEIENGQEKEIQELKNQISNMPKMVEELMKQKMEILYKALENKLKV